MKGAAKTATELEALIIGRLRESYSNCESILRVVVRPTGATGTWMAETVPFAGMVVPADCQRAKSAITHSLRRQFDLA